jgi:hypothetical protein
MFEPIRFALLSLTALTLACGPTTEDSASSTGSSGVDTDTAATDTEAATEPDVTTQADTEPTGVGFTFDGGTLPGSDPIDVLCQIELDGAVDPDISTTILLTCTDADAITHAVRVELRLFDGAALGLPADLEQVRMTHYRVDDFTVREVLTLRDADDALLLYAGYGYELFNADDAALRLPITYAPVADELCATEVIAECETHRRSAIDVGVADVSERMFDRDVAALPGFAVHLGAAIDIDRYPTDECIGDSSDGLEVSVIAFAS